MPDIVQTIRQHIRKRVSLAQRYLFQAQSTQVHDRWAQLLASCETNLDPPPSNTHLTEVTCSLRTASTCPVCGITYASLHALRTHIGKSHPEHSTAKTGQGYSERSYRHSELMQHSLDGQPACVHCRKCFASWRSFAGHIVQKACPLLFSPVPSLSEGPAQGVSAPGTQQGTMDLTQVQVIQPLVDRKPVQDLAIAHRVQELATAVRHEVLSGHCPICRYKCTDKSYISRHACFQHDFIEKPLVRAWARPQRSWQALQVVPANFPAGATCASEILHCFVDSWTSRTQMFKSPAPRTKHTSTSWQRNSRGQRRNCHSSRATGVRGVCLASHSNLSTVLQSKGHRVCKNSAAS